MNDLVKEAIRWLFGGGALALATFLATTAYQQGQLEIERERNLREFLDKYVDLATRGSLDERLRFVQYWESLDVSDKIGVDLTSYRRALRNEFNEAQAYAETLSAAGGDGGHPPASGTGGRPTTAPPLTEPAARPPVSTVQEMSNPQQEAYFASRGQTIAKLVPGEADASDLERRGFEALLANDIPAAREAFAAAEQAWPEYHNVAEIHRLLVEVSRRLPPGGPSLEPDIHRRLLAEILENFSWGMPPAIRNAMQTATRR